VKSVFEVLEKIYQSKKDGKTTCFHCAHGKHRTGIVAMLIQIASLEKIEPKKLDEVYEEFYHHTWFNGCASRYEYREVIPIIIKSQPFIDFRKKWRKVFG